MAIGTNRHYAVHEIMPRHFIQTAHACGMGESVITTILDEIRATSEAALGKALKAMPKAFPTEVADSITNGYRDRLRLLGSGDI
jgi:serine/threonine-protein kinase HipA